MRPPYCRRDGGSSMKQQNNFDTLRIISALVVAFSHAVPLSYGSNSLEPVWRLSKEQATAGTTAVVIFFVISGYLITQSFVKSQDVYRFAMARMLRIVPALLVVLVVLAFVAGPLLSILPATAYFAAAQTYRFVLLNVSFLGTTGELPGVFAHNPFPNTVNGSLWTLHYEVECYLLVLVLGALGLLNRVTAVALLMLGLAASALWLGGARGEMMAYFLAGSAIFQLRLPLLGWVALLCTVLWAAALMTSGLRIASATAGAYVIIYLAMSPSVRLPRLTRWGDLSYGIYIWAYPVQQLVASALAGRQHWWLNLAFSLPVILALSWLSWHFVEAPALRLKPARRTGPGQSDESNYLLFLKKKKQKDF